MNLSFITGIIGSLILVTGSAWPESKSGKHPAKSVKNWLFAVGGLTMLIYAILGYVNGGQIFFIFLETIIVISSVLMMFNVSDKIGTIIISLSGICLVVWSLFLFNNYNIIFFIAGLCGIALGYVLQAGTIKRSVALLIGSALITIFSFIEASWIFFWLNLFFAIFSGYYAYKGLK